MVLFAQMISLMITGQLYDIAFNYASTKLENLHQIQELPDLHPYRSHKAGPTLLPIIYRLPYLPLCLLDTDGVPGQTQSF